MDIRKETEKKVFSYIEENGMILPGEDVIVGVSGGADSVCLLFLLLEYQKKKKFGLHVVHLNHGIREEADRDAAYVKALCDTAEIPYYLTSVNVREMAKEEKLSEEAAGRQARYDAFFRVAEEQKAAKIAVAHNKNDNAETVLFHLFRGSGTGGLAGMSPVRKGEGGTQVVRPILCLTREEIEAYLTDIGVSWCQDITNAGDDYTRNKIRHHILPYAEREIVEGAVEHIHQSAQLMAETESYLQVQTQKALEEVTMGRGRIDCKRFQEISPLIQKRILFALAKELSPTGKDIGWVHVRDMMRLFERNENRSISLPFGIVASRSYDEVVLERAPRAEGEALDFSLPQNLITCVFTHLKFGRFEFRVMQNQENFNFPDNRCTKWFDYGKIKQSTMLRYRQEGDYLSIRDKEGRQRHKSLKQYMIDEKIPRQMRDSIPVLAEGNHIIWVVGYRISEFFKVTGNTKTVLEVKLIGKDCENQQNGG